MSTRCIRWRRLCFCCRARRGWSGARWGAGWQAERRLPTLCGVGETVPVTLTLTNTGRLPKQSLRAADHLPRRLHLVGERAPLILQLGPGESRDVTYSLEAERRGRLRGRADVVETTDPLGFYVFVQRAGGRSELAVYPTPLPLRRVFFEDPRRPAARPGGGAGAGCGTDFHGVAIPAADEPRQATGERRGGRARFSSRNTRRGRATTPSSRWTSAAPLMTPRAACRRTRWRRPSRWRSPCVIFCCGRAMPSGCWRRRTRTIFLRPPPAPLRCPASWKRWCAPRPTRRCPWPRR